MQISLRSQLVAGTAAVIGASAVAITPIAGPTGQLPGLHSAAVTLSAWANPFDALLSSGQLVNDDWLSDASIPNTPYDALQGIFPQLEVMNQPVQLQLSLNSYNYANALIGYLVTQDGSSLQELGSLVWGLPNTLLTATQQALTGNIPGALNTLSDGILVPLQNAAASAFTGVALVVGSIVTNIVNVLGTLPGVVSSGVNMGIDVATVLGNAAATAASNVLNSLTSLDFEGAWNAWVTGALSPAGFPGALADMTVGQGVGTWGADDYQPSIRVWANGSIYAFANALGGSYPTAPPAAAVQPAASLKAAAATAAAESEDGDTGTKAEVTADSEDSNTGNGAKSDESDNGSKTQSRANKTGAAHGKGHSARSAKSGNAA
ncbi:MAG: hypothetical protein U0R81_06120 [Mycobacterium sp.]